MFRINPRGTQYDALVTDEGRDLNVSWDEKWEVETRIEEDGWYAEIRIPLKSLRYDSGDDDTSFGVDFERIIRRKNEFTYWNNFSRDFQFEKVSQAGPPPGIGRHGQQPQDAHQALGQLPDRHPGRGRPGTPLIWATWDWKT